MDKLAILREALRDISQNWDHEHPSLGEVAEESDHPKQHCRACVAEVALKKTNPAQPDPVSCETRDMLRQKIVALRNQIEKTSVMYDDPKEHLLYQMRAFSEQRYSAHWRSGLEYRLWHAIVRDIEYFNTDPALLLQLASLSTEAEGWWYWDEQLKKLQFADFATWQLLYDIWLAKHPVLG